MEKSGMTFVQKLENYWYHYKWHTILGAFALCVILVCTVQCASRREADAMVMYAGNFVVAQEYREKSFESIMSADYNGDGKKVVDVFQLVLNIVEVDGDYAYYDPVAQNEELQRLEIELSTGNSVIYILHPYIYEQYKDRMRPLSEVLDTVPDYAVDDRGVPVSELVAYMTTTMNFYPENSILCIRYERTDNNLLTRADDPQTYANTLRFFREIVNY